MIILRRSLGVLTIAFGLASILYLTTTHQGQDYLTRVGNRIGALVSARFRADELELADYGHLDAYRQDNVNLPPDPLRVVLVGDSITKRWAGELPSHVLNRAVGGSTSSQMLLRFQQDVLDLSPRAVIILAGTNDLLWGEANIGFVRFQDNIEAMTELARSHGVEVVLCSIPPLHNLFPQQPHHYPEKVREWNSWLHSYAMAHGIIFVDYFSVLDDGHGDMKPAFTDDKVHPNNEGYAAMRPLLIDAVRRLDIPTLR